MTLGYEYNETIYLAGEIAKVDTSVDEIQQWGYEVRKFQIVLYVGHFEVDATKSIKYLDQGMYEYLEAEFLEHYMEKKDGESND